MKSRCRGELKYIRTTDNVTSGTHSNLTRFSEADKFDAAATERSILALICYLLLDQCDERPADAAAKTVLLSNVSSSARKTLLLLLLLMVLF